jgi:hypothetical protein
MIFPSTDCPRKGKQEVAKLITVQFIQRIEAALPVPVL